MSADEKYGAFTVTEFTTDVITEVLNAQELSSSLLMIEGEALFGAVLGAYLVTSTQRNRRFWRRLGSFALSAGVGYLFTPMALQAVPFVTSGGAAFLCALMIIPLSIKSMQWIKNTDIKEIIRRLRGR